MTKSRILITNDDGIFAPGLKHLWNAVKGIADITIVAPAVEQSASGLSITIRSPLQINQIDWYEPSVQAWSVTGTPSDCVKLALSIILKEKPALILSGINRGSNAGRNVLYSGTIAATIESILNGIPAIAFSHADFNNPQFANVEKYIPQIVYYVLHHSLPIGTLLNVNFPENCNQIKGIRLARQGKAYLAENPECRSHPSSDHSYYWLGLKYAQFEEEEDSDVRWLQKGYVAAVPIHVSELTDHSHINSHKKIFEDFVNHSRNIK